MFTVQKFPQGNPAPKGQTSLLEPPQPTLSYLPRKPSDYPYQNNSLQESPVNKRTAQVKTLLNRNISNTSALSMSRCHEGDDEPELPLITQSSHNNEDCGKATNVSKISCVKEYIESKRPSNLNGGGIFRQNSMIQSGSSCFNELDNLRELQRTPEPVRKTKGELMGKYENNGIFSRPGEMFKNARISISQGRVDDGVQKENPKQRMENSNNNKASPETKLANIQGILKKNHIELPRLENKASTNSQEETPVNIKHRQLTVLKSNKKSTESHIQAYGLISAKKEAAKNCSSQLREDSYSGILERRNTTEPSDKDLRYNYSSLSRKVYAREDSSKFSTPKRSHKDSSVRLISEDNSVLITEEGNQTFDNAFSPTRKKETRALTPLCKPPRAKLEGNIRKEVLGDIRELGYGHQSSMKAYLPVDNYGEAKYSWNKALEPRADMIQKAGYNSAKEKNIIKGIENLLRLKTSMSHQEKMKEYLRRRGLREDTRVFCFNSKDWHIKRVLERFGWVENPNIDSTLFDFKWSYRDSESDYDTLSEGQFFNHFGNNKELTMKSGLMKNLRDNCGYGNDEWDFFPRAYELGHESQVKEFKEDFERTMLGSLIKNLWEYIKVREHRGKIEKAKVIFWSKERAKQLNKSKKQRRIEAEKLGREKHQKKMRMFSKYAQRKYKKVRGLEQGDKWDEMCYEEVERRGDFLVHVELVYKALKCLRTIVYQQKEKILEDQHHFTVQDLPQKTQEALMKYCQADHFMIKIITDSKAASSGLFNAWKTPNQDLINRIYKYYSLLKLSFPQSQIDGSNNVWIVKPGGNSKGSGIFLINDIEEALESGIRNQSRVIQKYIERPLILRDFPAREMNGKKFDLRQWVLVTSVNPLTVYMFSSCYMRICSADFDLQDIKNNHRHLTNFSINQQNYGRNVQNSVCKVEYLKDYLKYTRNISWDKYIKPQIVNIILKTLSCVSDELEQRTGCFELYGFDVLLDETCKAWLLEVNLSPACKERTPWLMQMLNKMGLEMLKLVLPANYLDDRNVFNRENLYNSDDDDDFGKEGFADEMYWELISMGEVRETKEGLVNPSLALEVVGTKINWKKEQVFDKKYNCYRLVVLLQKNIRAFLLRRRIQERIENAKAKLIQRRARRFIVRVRYIRKMQLRALETVKRFVIKTFQAKFFKAFVQTSAAKLLQRHVRHRLRYLKERRRKGIKALEGGVNKLLKRKLMSGLKQISAVKRIQKFVRKRQAYLKDRREKGLKKLSMLMTKHIWRKLVKKMNNIKVERAAICIQKHLKRWRANLANEKLHKHEKMLAASRKIQKFWRRFRKDPKGDRKITDTDSRMGENKPQAEKVRGEKEEILNVKYADFRNRLRLRSNKKVFKLLKAWRKHSQKLRSQKKEKLSKPLAAMAIRIQAYWRMYRAVKIYRMQVKGARCKNIDSTAEIDHTNNQKENRRIQKQQSIQVYIVKNKPSVSRKNSKSNLEGDPMTQEKSSNKHSLFDLFKILKG